MILHWRIRTGSDWWFSNTLRIRTGSDSISSGQDWNRTQKFHSPLISASSTKSFAKSKRLILQFPTVTPSSTRLWFSIQFMLTSGSQPWFWEPHLALRHPLCGLQQFFNKTSNILCNRLRVALNQMCQLNCAKKI